MAETNILLSALDDRSRKLRKESDRTRQKYSEDSVHDLRVAARRLMAVLETLLEIRNNAEIQDCRKRVKKLLDGLSPLRDLHVQVSAVSHLAQRFPQLKDFETSLVEKESRTGRKVLKLLKRAPKLDQAIARSRRHAKRTIGRADILNVIDRRYRKVLSLAERVDPSNSETIHRTRLAFKKFRYTCEIAHPLIKKDVNAARLEEFHTFQTRMGDVQDIEVLTARLQKWAAKHAVENEMHAIFEDLKIERQNRIAAFVASVDEVRTFWKTVEKPLIR